MTNERLVTEYKTLVLALLALITASMAEAAEITPLMSKDLPDIPGKTVWMITVQKGAGVSEPIHQLFPLLHLRNYAHAFIYVLQGSMKVQVGNGTEVKLTQGQTWYEGPHDVHSIGRNVSTTEPVKFLVLFVRDKDGSIDSQLTVDTIY
jgi:mannose-6-phosphate isomerase-like protein (cupin superfamily)